MSDSTASADRDPAAWCWPRLARAPLGRLRAASFIEWRYYAVLSPAFHGIVGLALVNPKGHFSALAESGVLLIVAGVLDGPPPPSRAAPGSAPTPAGPPPALCWMHLFPMGACNFDARGPGSLTAGDSTCCIALRHDGPASADIEIEAGGGLELRLAHAGLVGTAIPARIGKDFAGPLGSSFGAHWTVDCPSPVAVTDGSLRIDRPLLEALAEAPGSTPGYATPALRERVAAGEGHWQWEGAAGYYEHSFGVRPLPLHGWDFLFAPDAGRGQSVVLQTYRGSRALRYLDVCWHQDGTPRRQRFHADTLRLDWPERTHDPLLGAWCPLTRRIEAQADGLRLSLHNRVLHRLPLLRPRKLAVRHFFISEEIGVADWTLSSTDGRELAAAEGQRCGGELAHFRAYAPRRRTGRPWRNRARRATCSAG